jgi:acyl-coenzyme A thioesterase PaaI-like protein
MDPIKTHEKIDRSLCGTPRVVSPGEAEVALAIIDSMRADEHGLAHGGFIFGLADYAAMLAVNEPTVVLADASAKFLAPVVVGDIVIAKARIESGDGKRQKVVVDVTKGDTKVLEATFSCAVPSKHVLLR